MLTLKEYAQELLALKTKYENHELSFTEYQQECNKIGSLFLTVLSM